MGLRKTLKNRAGVQSNFSVINNVQFLKNLGNTYTIVVKVDVYLNRKALRDRNEPVETNSYEFSIDKSERIGRLDKKINELLLTTEDYSGAVEEDE